MIHFENITLNVPGQTLLKETGLRIAPGDKVVIRGPSGSGKSSLLKAVAGARPILGKISVGGIALTAESIAEIRRRIAFIGQEPILGAETVREALLLPFTYKAHRGKQPDDQTIFQTLEKLHLKPGILQNEAKRISGGEKQRIVIARALLLNKTLFIADEITSALDPESKQAVITQLLHSEFTVLSVSHDPDWIKASTRIIDIINSKLQEAEV
ncbi:ABC transporter ATP-binding protein [Pontiella agarivorans]|uniref:ABC transporter ATP-binding protein n=1 Tax=Pontiella agarivorans TaxID=3038953 RepID=A0ABU5N071_9BACT|nr:ABC transporter ATP-binding protein [Pontiella agarivorans]MDZ8119837.1 ABC transporter ATP-binding protein [Pontiella agarivorans]